MGCANVKEQQKSTEPSHEEKPFADDGPTVTDDSTDYDADEHARRAARRTRSKSVAKLQEISSARQTLEDDEDERDVVKEVGEHSPTEAADSPEVTSPVKRRRRLSSIYSDFTAQVDHFLNNSHESPDAESENTLRRMFDTLDITQTGQISREALEEGFRRMGLTSSSQQVNEMFMLADKDKRGALKWEEFFTFFRSLASLDTQNAEEADELQALKAYVPRQKRRQSMSSRFLRRFEMRPFAGFAKRVKSMAVSPNRPLVAAVDREDNIAHLFDIDTGKELRRLVGHQDSMLCVVFSPDRKTVATAGRDNLLVIWDSTVGHELCSCKHPGVVTACDFSFDGKWIYSGCQDNLVRKLSASKGRCHRIMERMPQSQLGVIVAVATQHCADRHIIVTRSCDKVAHVLDSTTLAPIATLSGHSGMVWHCGFNEDDNLIYTQCDKIVGIWSATDYSKRFHIAAAGLPALRKPPGKRSRLFTTVTFGPREFSTVLIAAANDSTLYVIRLDTGEVLLPIDVRSSVYAVAVSSDLNAVFCGDDVGNMFSLRLY